MGMAEVLWDFSYSCFVLFVSKGLRRVFYGERWYLFLARSRGALCNSKRYRRAGTRHLVACRGWEGVGGLRFFFMKMRYEIISWRLYC